LGEGTGFAVKTGEQWKNIGKNDDPDDGDFYEDNLREPAEYFLSLYVEERQDAEIKAESYMERRDPFRFSVLFKWNKTRGDPPFLKGVTGYADHKECKHIFREFKRN
jgi:hypothetical protein